MKMKFTPVSAFIFAGLWLVVALLGLSAQNLAFTVGGSILAIAFVVLAVFLMIRRGRSHAEQQ